MRKYRLEPTSVPRIMKVVDDQGRWVGEIRRTRAAESSIEQWAVYLGPGAGAQSLYETPDAAFEAIVTHAEANPTFRIQ